MRIPFIDGLSQEVRRVARAAGVRCVFKHGLLERSTILLQDSAITSAPMESSPLGELKYAISAG